MNSKPTTYEGDVTANDLETWALNADMCEAVNGVVSYNVI